MRSDLSLQDSHAHACSINIHIAEHAYGIFVYISLIQGAFFPMYHERGQRWFQGLLSPFFPFMTEVLILITMFFTSLGPGIARRWLSFNCANFGRRFKMYATKRRRRTVKTYVSISTFSIPCHTIDTLKQWSYVSKRQLKRFESLIYQL